MESILALSVLKTRDGIKSYRHPGWYDAPAGNQATIAADADLKRDAIDPQRPPAAEEEA